MELEMAKKDKDSDDLVIYGGIKPLRSKKQDRINEREAESANAKLRNKFYPKKGASRQYD